MAGSSDLFALRRPSASINFVCAHDGADVFEGLGSLIEKSLVQQNESEDGMSRFSMLETIREYASQQLEERGERDELRRRHAEYVLTLVQSEADLMGEHGPPAPPAIGCGARQPPRGP